jgi:hypothetical protein
MGMEPSWQMFVMREIAMVVPTMSVLESCPLQQWDCCCCGCLP